MLFYRWSSRRVLVLSRSSRHDARWCSLDNRRLYGECSGSGVERTAQRYSIKEEEKDCVRYQYPYRYRYLYLYSIQPLPGSDDAA